MKGSWWPQTGEIRPCYEVVLAFSSSAPVSEHGGGQLRGARARVACRNTVRAVALLVFLQPPAAFRGLPDWSFSVAGCSRHSRAPQLGSLSVQPIRRSDGHPLWGLSLFSAADARGPQGRERPRRWLHSPRVTRRYRLASTAAGLWSTVVSLMSPQAISLQSGADGSQPLRAPGDLRPCPGYVGLWPGVSVWLSFHSITGQLWHSPAASDAGSLSQTVALLWGSEPCFSSLTPWVQVQSCSLSLFLSFLL